MIKTSNGFMLTKNLSRWTTVICSLSVLFLSEASADCTASGLKPVTVQSGDTLGEISQKLYGTSKRWSDLYRWNADRIVDANRIEVGTELCAGEITTETRVVETSTEGTYLVEQGDTLSTISEKIYGTFRKWTVLFELNQDQLKSPHLIYVGMRLKTGDPTSPQRTLASEKPLKKAEPVAVIPQPVVPVVKPIVEAKAEVVTPVVIKTVAKPTPQKVQKVKQDIVIRSERITDEVTSVSSKPAPIAAPAPVKERKIAEQPKVKEIQKSEVIEVKTAPKIGVDRKQQPAVQLKSYSDWEVSL